MRIAVRTDAGKQIGYGHLRRCMTLANALRPHEVRFWIAGDEAARGLAEQAGFDAVLIEADELARIDAEPHDAMIVDSYRVDEGWYSAARARVPLLLIDDLADRMLDADVITNSAVGAVDLAYRTRPGCRLLLGPAYALVRPAFRDAAHAVRPAVERVLVTLGGSDPQFRTRIVVATLRALLPSVQIDAVLGPLHGDDEPLEDLARRDPHLTLHRAPDLAPLVASADIAVSAGGGTTFELAAAGVPVVAIAVADNQRLVLAGFERAGTLLHAGDADAPDVAERLRSSVDRVVADESLRATMSKAGRRLVDGCGAERVAAALLEQIRD